jgi:hypothetical protein
MGEVHQGEGSHLTTAPSKKRRRRGNSNEKE